MRSASRPAPRPVPRRLLLAVLPLVASAAVATACWSGAASEAQEIDADRLPALALGEELRIGSLDDPDLGFSRILGVRVAPDGRMFVLESQDRQVRVYDADGRPLRRLGRPGQGPGEFQSVNGFGLVGDTVWVLDQQSRRITLFSTGGGVLATVPAHGVDLPVDVPDVRVNAYPVALREDGRFNSGLNIVTMAGGGQTRPFSVPRLVFDATGAPVDTAGVYEYRPPPQVRIGDRSVSAASPLTDTPLRLEEGRDTLIVERPVAGAAAEGRFTAVRVTESGDTLFRRVFRYRPHPITPAARDSLVQARVALPMRSFPPSDTAAVRSAVAAAMALPPFHPPVSTARVSADGGLWVRREDDGSDRWRWIVLAPDGEVRGVLELSKAATPQWIDGDRLWVVEPDDFGVPWLVRYRLRA